MSENCDKIVIYCDGSCKPNPGKGGWAAILMFRDNRKELMGQEEDSTNNRMELMACIRALEALILPCAVEVVTDSQYVKLGITRWVKRWAENGWRSASGEEIKNRDLWERLIAIEKEHDVEWTWVKGHYKDEENKRVDALANIARFMEQIL